MRSRDITKYSGHGQHTFRSLDEALNAPVRDGLTTVRVGNREFDFFYVDRNSNVTIITFSAAMPQSISTYPIFSGLKMTKDLNANLLAFTDPVNGKEGLPTFWHLGVEGLDSVRIIPQVISHALKTRSGQSALFFGSSAGGFAALNYSRLFPRSAAFVMNPRVNILNEPKRLPKYAPTAFPNSPLTEVVKSLPMNLPEIYSSPQGNRVFYLQNLQDSNYTRHHYLHFKKAVEGRNDCEFITGNWGVGHVVPPKSAYIKPLENLVLSAPNWTLEYDPYGSLFF